MSRFGLRLTPQGHLVAEDQEDAPEIGTQVRARLTEAFAQGSGYGLVRLGAGEVGQALSPVFVWWRAFATRYVDALCLNASGREDDVTLPVVPVPEAGELASLVLSAPMRWGPAEASRSTRPTPTSLRAAVAFKTTATSSGTRRRRRAPQAG